MTADLRNRGVHDIIIACCDGLAGFEDAFAAAFPAAVVQRCVVHLVRNALRPAARREAAAVAAQLRTIYTAPGEDAALEALAAFAASDLGKKYPQAVRVWEDAWDAFIPFLAFTPPVRKLLYTTNSIESLNYQLRKVTKARGHFPSDDAVVKLWPRSCRSWSVWIQRARLSGVCAAASRCGQQLPLRAWAWWHAAVCCRR